MSDDKEIRDGNEPKIKMADKEEIREGYDPDVVIKGELDAIDCEIDGKYKDALDGVLKAKFGLDYIDAQAGLANLVISFSNLMSYIKKTEKLYNKFEKIGAAVKYAATLGDRKEEVEVFQYFKTMEKLSATMTSFCNYALEINEKKIITYAYTIRRFDEEIVHLADANTMNRVIFGLNEYNALRVHYDNADIFKELKMRKTVPPEENYQIAKSHLDNYINGTKDLKVLLDSGMQNNLFVLDRFTCAFHYVYLAKDSIKAYIDTSKKLRDDCLKVMNDRQGKRGAVNAILMKTLLDIIIEMLENALNLIDKYVNETSKPPYSALHYDMVVKDVTSRWLGESLPDPITNGSKYEDIVKDIKKSWDKVLRPIAKNAAKWGID